VLEPNCCTPRFAGARLESFIAPSCRWARRHTACRPCEEGDDLSARKRAGFKRRADWCSPRFPELEVDPTEYLAGLRHFSMACGSLPIRRRSSRFVYERGSGNRVAHNPAALPLLTRSQVDDVKPSLVGTSSRSCARVMFVRALLRCSRFKRRDGRPRHRNVRRR
jgi:hypothetical protein